MSEEQKDYCAHCGQPIQVSEVREFAGWSLDRVRMTARYKGDAVHLPRAEFMVFYSLMEKPNELVSREALMQAIGASKARGNILNVYVSFLRAKFQALESDISIRSRRGLGYTITQGVEILASRVRKLNVEPPSPNVILHEGGNGTPPFREILKKWGSVFIDETDAHLLDGFTLSFSGQEGSKVVAVTSHGDPAIRMALGRHILRAPEGMMADHINGDPCDNRRANLRLCTKTQNSKNRTKREGCASKYKGVTLCKATGKWISNINDDGQRFYLGIFEDEVEAALAYDAAARRMHREFASLNFPNEGERNALSRGDTSILIGSAA